MHRHALEDLVAPDVPDDHVGDHRPRSVVGVSTEQAEKQLEFEEDARHAFHRYHFELDPDCASLLTARHAQRLPKAAFKSRSHYLSPD